MNIGRYAPSGRFTAITLSLLLSAGLIYGANYVTHPQASTASVDTSAVPAQPDDSANWVATLDAIQANNASTSLSAPDPTTVNEMLAAAESSNITDSVGKSLLINLGSAKSQGLGDDIPTQNQIVAQAAAQIAASKPNKVYTSADLTIVADSPATLKAYGNGVIQILDQNPAASEAATLTAVGNATDKNDASELDALPPIGDAYASIVTQLLALPVPKTLSPFDLSTINTYSAMVATYPDMEATLTDPLRGIVGMQTFEAQLDLLGKVFTNIASALNKDGILFNKGEPGSIWQSFLGSS
jgi:hypothetical protein